MRLKTPRMQRWQFSVTVLAPAVASLVITAVAVIGFVVWSTNGIDQRSLGHQLKLAATAVERQTAQIPYAQESVARWDEAVARTRDSLDRDWLDGNLGVWMHEYYGFDVVVIYDAKGRTVYQMSGGATVQPELTFDQRAALAPLISEIRTAIAAGALDAYERGATKQYPRALDVKVFNGKPAIVSVVPISSQNDAIRPPRGSEFLHVAIDYLDQKFADSIAQNYLFAHAGFRADSTVEPDQTAYPVLNRGGRIVTFFEWQPDKPGQDLLRQTGPVLGAAFVIATLLVTALLNRLWLSSATLESERLAARHQAAHDPLTGLPNRHEFERQLAQALAPGQTSPVALLMIDLDRFKQVNDTLGHHAGDELIRAVSQRLRAIVGTGDMLARLGGDEFGVINTSAGTEQNALDLANAIIEAISKSFIVSGSEVFVGASIGIALSSTGRPDPDEMARKADIALYEAKSTGRNRVVPFTESMSEAVQNRHMIEAELREALRAGMHISVAFQPLFAANGDIPGAEALVRWHHPRLGQISPARFIPVAEAGGLIEELGDLVLQRACAFGAQWPGRRVAVNISPAQLRNPNFPERVFDLLVESAMRPSDLELEITESILLDDENKAIEALTTFREAGIRIALDDFGTGYSSLNYLKRYPVDRIKIDRSFVSQLGTSNASDAIVRAMITLAHALDIEVTAEGVETDEQLSILRSMDCNLFQGFLLSAPISAEALTAEYQDLAVRKSANLA